MALLACLLLGWWSLRGLFLTPVQIAKNLRDICRDDQDWRPSEGLLRYARIELADAVLKERNEGRWKFAEA